MDLKQIEYFVRVAEMGSFTRASIALDVAQSALSRQVRLLETELQQTLLIRNGRGVTPTDAGKIMLEHGRGVLHQIDHLREELSREREGLVGKVALGLPPSLSNVLTVPLMRTFQAELPDVVISISESLSLNLQQGLIDGRLDVVMLYDASPSHDIDVQPLITQDLYLLEPLQSGRSKAEITLKELADIPLIMPRRPNVIRMHVETKLAELGLHPKVVIEVDAISAILDLIAEGYGYGVLPFSTIHALSQPERFNLRLITEPKILTKLSLAVSAHRPLTKVQRNLIKLIEAKVLEVINASG